MIEIDLELNASRFSYFNRYYIADIAKERYITKGIL